MNKRLHLIIHGKVQEVFFRDNTRKKAQSLGLTGWVKNNSDGTVEAMIEGEENKLKDLLEFCKQSPESSQVDNLEEHWEDCKDEFTEFQIES